MAEANPLDTEWEITHTIPAPGKTPSFLVRDGDSFWTLCGTTQMAYKFSMETGMVETSVKLPGDIPSKEYLGLRCFGIWNDSLITAVWDDATVTEYSKTTGDEISEFSVDGMWSIGSGVTEDGELMVVSHDGVIFRIEKTDTGHKKKKVGLITGGASYLAPIKKGFWYYGIFTRCLHRTDLKRNCLEWGENPLQGDVAGVSVVNGNLCILDADKKEICFLRRAKQKKKSEAQ